MIDWIGVSVPAAATLIYIGLLWLVLSSPVRTAAKQVFAVFLGAFVIWTSGSLAWHLSGGMLWNHILVSGATLGVLAFVYFVYVFLAIERRIVAFVVPSLAVACLITIWTNLVVSDSYLENGVAHMTLGPAFALNILLTMCVYCWSMAQLIRHYRRQSDPIARYHIQYLILGLGLWWLGVFTNALPDIGNYPIDVALGIVSAVLMAYAILHHQLLDITVLVRRGLAYSVLTTTVAASYLISVFILQGLLQRLFGANAFFSAFAVAVGFAVLYNPLRRRTQYLVDRIFFRERTNVQHMLAEISQKTASIMDVDDLGRLVLDRIAASMSVERAVLFVSEKDEQTLQPLAQRGFEPPTMYTFLAENPLVQTLRADSLDTISGDLLLRLPSSIGMLGWERRGLEALDIQLFVPIKLKGELVGLLALGPKISETPYSRDDILALKTLANQIAVAIGNTRLVADLQHSLIDLKHTQDQLIQAAKLSAVGQLVAGVAHELNNPLTAVKGYAELLRTKRCRLTSAVTCSVSTKLQIVAVEIVRNLLTFARRHSPELSQCDINDILEVTLSLQAYRFRVENVEVQTDLASNLPTLLADQYQLQQVFFNIISNAQQAMSDTNGGILRVGTERAGEIIRIVISDTGPGITPEVQARVFEPFFTTKAVGEGTGLGLSICYGIIQTHEGRIHLQSTPGRGATFIVELPIRSIPAPAVAEPKRSKTDGRLKDQRILVVDDEESILALIERTLTEEGMIVDSAATGVQALELLEQHPGPRYDLILSDVKMPGLDGGQLYTFLRYNHSGLEKRIVFMTGDTSNLETLRFLESANVNYIAKPFELAELRDKVLSGLYHRS